MARRATRWSAGFRDHEASDEDPDDEIENGADDNHLWVTAVSGYAGKWGRYVRAPDFYFEIVSFGEIAHIRFGVKSGCDAFFVPHDITKRAFGNRTF